MAVQFPSSPTDGQYYPVVNPEFIYNATKTRWDSLPLQGAKTITADTAPAGAKDGDQWLNTVTNILYIWVVDTDGGQWIESQAPITANGYYSPNYIINGGMDIWQRGTTVTLGVTGLTNYYTADRWATYNPNGTGVLAQDTVNVPTGFRYGLKFTASAANSSCAFYHTVETLETTKFAGKTVTISVYLSGTAGTSVEVALKHSTTVDAAWYSTFTTVTTQTFTVTATPTRYSFTTIVPSTAKTAQVFINTGTLANTSYVSFTGVQLEEGNAATTFRRNANSLQGELAACQRYYWRTSASSGSSFCRYAIGDCQGTTGGVLLFQPPVQMRAIPAAIEYLAPVGNYSLWSASTRYICTSLAIATQTTSSSFLVDAGVDPGMTAGRSMQLLAYSVANTYIAFSAEL